MIFINSKISGLLFASLAMTLAGPSAAHANNNEIAGFRYQSCLAQKCVVVEALKAWLSQSNGAFVATGDVTLRLVDGPRIREFKGNEAVSQPEINSITLESFDEVVLVDTALFSIERFGKQPAKRDRQ